jgi:hypothetical protein
VLGLYLWTELTARKLPPSDMPEIKL